MGIFSVVGPKHFYLVKKWIPSLGTFGFAGLAAGCYGTEWKAVLQYLPYYNGKYKTEEES